MRDDDEIINSLINDVRVHRAILILGAGASYESGMPLYAQFPPIIWKIVDEFPDIKEFMGWSKTNDAKDMIGTDIDKIKEVFNFIEKNNEANSRFKELFKNVNDSHKNGELEVHKEICKLIHSGFIKLVVSFNWDDLLETAWETLFGTDINANKINLVKPHGDVRNLQGCWIYPNSDGYLPEKDSAIILRLISKELATFIILGYSERDAFIVDNLIKPSEKNMAVYRISPFVYGENAIPLKAREAMNKLSEGLCENDDKLWIRLDFSNQVGIEHAIMGYRLLPSDVVACPRLPQIDEAKIKLNHSHYVIIEGEAGSGKSITSYQLAWDYLQEGWEVMKLNLSKYEISKTNIKLSNNMYKTIFIIDDAQIIELENLVQIMTQTNNLYKLIITQTLTSNFPSESVTISQQKSVQVIYEDYKNRKEEILPIIKPINKIAGRYVGDKPMETSYDFVLDLAKREKSVWLFNYSLRGGWQNTTNQYDLAKGHNRSDILLTFISLRQILSLDKPVEIKWLDYVLSQWEYSHDKILEQLDYLYKHKLILSNSEIRTLHLQMAIRVITNYIKQASKEEIQKFQEIFRNEILNINTPLLGIAWFFNMLFGYDVKSRLTYGLFTQEFNENLLNRCKVQIDSELRSHACNVIDRVLRLEAGYFYEDLIRSDDFLIRWIENVNDITAYSFSEILNNMINESVELHESFVNNLDMQCIIKNLKKINPDYIFHWAKFLDRLLYNRKSDGAKAFQSNFPKKEISNALQQCNDIGSISGMLCTLIGIDENYAFQEYNNSIWKIEKSMKNNFMDTLRNLDLHFFMYFLGESLFDIGKPNKKQKEAGKALVECITVDMIRNSILFGTPQDWDNLYRFSYEIMRYDSDKFKEAINGIDLNYLSENVDLAWNEQPEYLIKLLDMLALADEKRTDEWIFLNREKISKIDTGLILFSPRTAEYVSHIGGTIVLTGSYRFEMNANAIRALISYNKKLCVCIIDENLYEIKKSIYNLSEMDWDDYYLFLKQILRVKKDIVNLIIDDTNIEFIKTKWLDTIKNEYYKSEKKKLNGLKELSLLIEKNTCNEFVKEYMNRIQEKINSVQYK